MFTNIITNHTFPDENYDNNYNTYVNFRTVKLIINGKKFVKIHKITLADFPYIVQTYSIFRILNKRFEKNMTNCSHLILSLTLLQTRKWVKTAPGGVSSPCPNHSEGK